MSFDQSYLYPQINRSVKPFLQREMCFSFHLFNFLVILFSFVYSPEKKLEKKKSNKVSIMLEHGCCN